MVIVSYAVWPMQKAYCWHFVGHHSCDIFHVCKVITYIDRNMAMSELELNSSRKFKKKKI